MWGVKLRPHVWKHLYASCSVWIIIDHPGNASRLSDAIQWLHRLRHHGGGADFAAARRCRVANPAASISADLEHCHLPIGESRETTMVSWCILRHQRGTDYAAQEAQTQLEALKPRGGADDSAASKRCRDICTNQPQSSFHWTFKIRRRPSQLPRTNWPLLTLFVWQWENFNSVPLSSQLLYGLRYCTITQYVISNG